MRLKLKQFRISQNNLSQKGMSDKIGCSLACYQSIESGRRNGSIPFVQKHQKAFNLSGEEVIEMMENEPNRKKNNCPTD